MNSPCSSFTFREGEGEGKGKTSYMNTQFCPRVNHNVAIYIDAVFYLELVQDE